MNRNTSVELLKLIASFFIICIHSGLWSSVDHFSSGSSSFIICNIARFAIPFFFVAGGYFTTDNRDKYHRRMKRLALLLLFWSCVFLLIRYAYQLPYPFFAVTDLPWADHLLNGLYRLVNCGFERHLWFLPAYMTGLFLLYQLRQERRLMIIIAMAAYLIGLAGQGWCLLFVPRECSKLLHDTFFTRDGLFFAFPCMAAGYSLRGIAGTGKIPSFLYLLLITGLFVLQYLETIFFYKGYHYIPDYTIVSVFLALALLDFSLRINRRRQELWL